MAIFRMASTLQVIIHLSGHAQLSRLARLVPKQDRTASPNSPSQLSLPLGPPQRALHRPAPGNLAKISFPFDEAAQFNPPSELGCVDGNLIERLQTQHAE